MELHRDFRELLESFNAHGVEYVLVGAYALAFHGAPRYTGDLDLFVRPVPENARRIIAALGDFGFGSLGLTVEDFTAPDRVVQLGVPPVRVDLVTSLTGVSWDEVWSARTDMSADGIRIAVINRAAFVKNKRATGRPKDLVDAGLIDTDEGTPRPD
jgi:hypothetical protein